MKNRHSDQAKRAGIAGLLLLAYLGAGAPLAAKEAATPITGNAALGIFNRYVFRGYRLGGDSLVVQPSLSFSCGGFSATFWGNIDTKETATPNFVPDRPHQKSFNETDLTVAYSLTAGRLNLTAGFIYYGTKYATETQEIYVSAAWNGFGNPTLAVYQDIAAYPGTYILCALGQSFPVGKATLDLGASAACFLGEGGYWGTYQIASDAYDGKRYRALHDGVLKARTTFPLGDKLSLLADIQCVFPLSKAASKVVAGNPYNINGNLTTVFVCGLSLSYGF